MTAERGFCTTSNLERNFVLDHIYLPFLCRSLKHGPLFFPCRTWIEELGTKAEGVGAASVTPLTVNLCEGTQAREMWVLRKGCRAAVSGSVNFCWLLKSFMKLPGAFDLKSSSGHPRNQVEPLLLAQRVIGLILPLTDSDSISLPSASGGLSPVLFLSTRKKIYKSAWWEIAKERGSTYIYFFFICEL